VRKNLVRIILLLLTVAASFCWGCGRETAGKLELVVPVQVPAAAVTEHSALLTWYWPASRPQPPGIVDYNLYINDWAAGGTKDWAYGRPGQPRQAQVYKVAGGTGETKYQCTLTGLEDYTYYQVYLEPVRADGKTLPRSMMAFATRPAGEVLRVMEYGVLGEKATDDTELLQRIINLCPPGGKVVLRRGTYFSGPLRLHGDMTLQLEAGAVLTALPAATPNVAAVLPLPEVPLALLNCVRGESLRVLGAGKIVGAAYPLLSCRQTGNVCLQDVELEAGNGAASNLVLRDCHGVAFNNVAFRNFRTSGVELTGSTELVVANCRLP
jgi:hypothetical protein